MQQTDYYQSCLANARNELDEQIAALIQHCAEATESNEAEATFVAAHKIEMLVYTLKQMSSSGIF